MHIVIGQMESKELDLADLVRRINDGEFCNDCGWKAMVIALPPLKWTIDLEFVGNLTEREPEEVMFFIYSIFRSLGNGSYLFRGMRRDLVVDESLGFWDLAGAMYESDPVLSSFWDTDIRTITECDCAFEGLPLRLIITDQSIVVEIYSSWLTEFLTRHFSLPMQPNNKTFEEEHSLYKAISSISNLTKIQGPWLFRIVEQA